jgi:hypothetical protein
MAARADAAGAEQSRAILNFDGRSVISTITDAKTFITPFFAAIDWRLARVDMFVAIRTFPD